MLDDVAGVAITRLTLRKIAEAEIPVAPLAVQDRIVEKLEELLSDLDAGVAELKAAQRKLVLYRQSLLKAAAEGSLTAEWRKRNKPAETGAQLLEHILVERRKRWETKQLAKFKDQGKVPPKDWRNKYPEPEDPDTANLPNLPDSWAWISLDQLFESLRSGSAETSRRTPTSIPILKSSAVRPNSIDLSAKNYLTGEQCKPEHWLELGDVLITRLSGSVEYVGCAGVVSYLPEGGMQYPDRIFCGKLVPVASGLARLVVHYLSSMYSRARIEKAAKSTAGHKRISLSDLTSLPIPIPPSTEIEAITDSVDVSLARVVDLLKYIVLAQSQVNAQQQNILKSAFSGQLVPQDPNDEPAGELLARIRAEREARPPMTKSRRTRKETA